MQKYKLSDVAIINPKDKINDLSISVSFVPMQNVSETGNIDVSEIRQALEVSKGFTSFIDGDVLMAKITPCMENGKGAVAAGLCNGRGFGSTEFFVIRPDHSRVRSEWIYYYTVQKRFRLDCERNMTGSAGQKRVPKAYLENSEIGIPSLTEQDHVLSKLRQAKKIIILRQQQLQKLDELVKARFVEMFGDPVTNPQKWRLVELGELTEIGSSKRIFEKEYVLDGVPFYRTKEIVELSKGNPITTELYITENRFVEIKQQYGVPKAGDLLISAVGTIGVIWIVDGKNDFYFKDGNLIRVNGSDKFNPIYMKNLLENLIAEYKKKISSGTAYAALTISGLTKMKVYDVPMGLQNQFATFVKQVDKSKATVQKALDETQLLFDSLMQKYFG